MEDIKLYIFGMNNTLTNTPFIDKAPLTVLPGRKEKLAELKQAGAKLAIASNQGGVAFGFQSEAGARAEVQGILEQLDMDFYRVSFGHPKPKWGYEEYGTPEMLAMRKPAPGMLKELMQQAGVSPQETLMIGDMDEDQGAAEAAGCSFMWAKDFFANFEELLVTIFHQYRAFAQLLDGQQQPLGFLPSGEGWVGYSKSDNLIYWNTLQEAPQAIEQQTKEWTAWKAEQAKKRVMTIPPDDFDPFLDSDDLP